MIEAAWLEIPDPNQLVFTNWFCKRYNPGKPIELGALATHHILDEELAACPPASEFAIPPHIQYLVGHNVDYDWEVIGKPDIKRICTLALARSLLPNLDSYSQSALLYHFERSVARDKLKNAHSALQDVENCLIILGHLIPLVTNGFDTTWEALWVRSEAARIPTVMPFGKHRNTPIAQIPADYKRWLLGQPDIDPYLIKALRGEAA